MLQPLTATQHTILVVDDNATNLKITVEYLKREGFKLLVARDGESALQKALYAQPNLILLDVMMPGIDGFATCQQLKSQEETKHIPVIFMTALAETINKVKGFEAGAVDYVTKPLQHGEVVSRIRLHLRLCELNQQLQETNANLEQKVSERTAELQQAYHTLAKLDQTKSDFINVIAHELRTPLSVTKMSAQMLQQQLEKENNQLLIEGILRGADRMHMIINDMLQITRIEADTLHQAFEKTEMVALLKQVVNPYYTALETRHIQLHWNISTNLPAICGAPDLLEIAFTHLLTNAIKYTPDGGHITLHLRQKEQWLQLIFEDTGIGINAEDHSLIFEKFYQLGDVHVHSTGSVKFKGGGAGLGLAIAKGFIEHHQGTIWVESAEHDETTYPGSRFYVQLPVLLADR